ncbi:dTMP kinase [Asticcacaulis sp. EMRT-3]|uniref:dTMP kinase n=1 Tax=Asticcacaulis sp. EMRT-3 TaxID=3040349 RepID=UPI0024AF8753|nr:dTMP kinase [Asticcacaulis sp. EMRT-3]MDI7774498.1 dTMP kinase [Asticcacaulis sp. EMRT-3]
MKTGLSAGVNTQTQNPSYGRGRFIVFEGGEGAGKSTQVRALVAHLRGFGLEVVATREPGGSPGAEALRDLLVKGEASRWSAISELLMMYAARADHLEKVIRPALMRGAWVVCDRFADSSRAYQGAGGGVAPQFIEQVDAAVVADTQPDLVLVMDMPPEAGLARAHARGDTETRFESMGLAFHERLRQGFLARAAGSSERYRVLDADRAIDAIADDVQAAVRAAFPELQAV